jgi:transmembrane sensor
MERSKMKRDINALASDWVARIDGRGLSPAEEEELNGWLAQDIRHRGAFARARAVISHFDKAAALGRHYDPGCYSQGRGLKKRSRAARLLAFRRIPLVASLAAALVAMVIGAALFIDRPQQIATRRGEVRLIPLDDGSAITLNTATRLAVSYSERIRDIELLEGEALFNVARDATRPFVVQAGDTRVRAVGTSFTVRHLAGEPVKVIVREGAVQVTRAGARQGVHLEANELAYSSPSRTTKGSSLPDDELSRQLAWQQGMISLDGMTLAQAAAEFGRYSETRIVIDDPAIASRTVTGLFAASNPAGFARAIATSMDLEAVVRGEAVHIHQ